MIAFRGQKKVGPRPDWSPLGVQSKSKFPTSIPTPFIWEYLTLMGGGGGGAGSVNREGEFQILRKVKETFCKQTKRLKSHCKQIKLEI